MVNKVELIHCLPVPFFLQYKCIFFFLNMFIVLKIYVFFICGNISFTISKVNVCMINFTSPIMNVNNQFLKLLPFLIHILVINGTHAALVQVIGCKEKRCGVIFLHGSNLSAAAVTEVLYLL